MDLWRSAAGMVRCELTSADPAGSLRAIGEQGIALMDTVPVDPLTVRFTVSRRDHRVLRVLAKRRGERLKLCRRFGIYWTARRLLRRPILLGGMAVLALLSLWLPSRVLFLRVDGNDAVPERKILEAAADCGIRFGASRREIRSEKMKNALLEAIPELQWAGINTSGCTAVISVREKTASQPEKTFPGVTHIVAARDGVIASCTVTAGSPQCAVGDAVEKGQVLVSGYTDCGLYIRGTRSEGEILGITEREMTAIAPAFCAVRGQQTGKRVSYRLRIGKKEIFFFKNSGISDATCGRMVTVKQLTLPGGFSLPAALVTETVTVNDTQRQALGADLESFTQRYLLEQMLAGQILTSTVRVDPGDEIITLSGKYQCMEMLGIEQNGEITEHHGETDRTHR